MRNLTTDERVAIDRTIRLLNTFRDISPKTDMTMSEALTFLLIAKGETSSGGGITISEVNDQGEMSLSSASRYMRSLSDVYKDRQGNPGHALVTHMEDPVDGRRKILRATEKGHSLLVRITNTILKG